MATKKSTVVPASPQVRPAAPAPSTALSRKAALEEVFGWDDEKKNLETALQSVSYLLDWSSENGNEPVDGFVAQGLYRLLRKAADDLSRLLYTQDEALAAGADFQKLRHAGRGEVAVPVDGEIPRRVEVSK